MRTVSIALVLCAALLAAVSSAHGWPWNVDMFNQVFIKPQERPMSPPPNTVPTEGWERPIQRIEAGNILTNPILATEESVKRGKDLFGIHCSPCHGPEGAGDGTIAKVYMMPPALGMEFIQQRADGYLYGTVHFGGPVMPPYGDAITRPDQKWDLVNFIRSLAR